MNTKKLSLLAIFCAASSALFSLTLISFHADISLVALPISLVFTALLAFFSIKKLFGEENLSFIAVFRELLQYLPYVLLVAFVFRRAGESGTPFALDVLSVILWLLSSILSLVILHFLNPKYIGKVNKSWAAFLDKQKTERKNPKNRSFIKSTVREILSWVDALVQAVFMVLLLNIFIVQLYEIPSESMVPEFLIKDRVVVFKTLSGPKFPLSDVGLPYLKKYNRGDIVVFRNPHYSNDRKSEVRTFLSQLVYMCTLTKVNLNVDENGNQKADPLVKRVRGVAGEQLMMQDGVLYARTKNSHEFKVVDDDSYWANWDITERKDLFNVSENSMKVERIPISFIEQKNIIGIGKDKNQWQYTLSDALKIEKTNYERLLACEENRRNFSVENARSECRQIAEDFASISKKFKNKRNGTFSLPKNRLALFFLLDNNAAITAELLASENGAEWFSAFMTDWSKSVPDFADDLYSESNYRLNLMSKLAFGKLCLQNALLYQKSADEDAFQNDEIRVSCQNELQELEFYLQNLDNRNMPVFPANDESGNPRYIPENCYFMMGDNRFNSQDMRHSYEYSLKSLTPYDDYSVVYASNMSPQAVSRNRILGTASYRFWPVSRAGWLGAKRK